ncbi:MAG: hypothetical protein WAX14_16310 [Rhodococcus sp. (in: high G+C Gram-positive bacteria)]|uniref:hypothetical protein n=1 Tax=Rhodococcus sp. TaxID=1831 RepID=UPI003BB751EA
MTLSGVVGWLRFDPRGDSALPGEELGADSPTGEGAARATRLQQSRIVRASVQQRAAGAGDLEWAVVSASVLHAVSVEESGSCRATWTGSVALPWSAGYPGLRQPGTVDSEWRVLVEEYELLNADPSVRGEAAGTVERLIYADEVPL